MTYTVLARRYRSRSFDELVGQEPIARTLSQAIETNRIAHAYLFTGPRGVGKTSAARILAKCLNCQTNGVSAHPCGACDSCTHIAAGDDIDVIEIDGASNRGIDNIRELRSNAMYRTARSRFKIYVIDEVHALTNDAFNALLKTLEEPPEHVKFIFCTTEPNKVLPTIVSRCQRFDFRNIPAATIAEHLAEVCKAEKAAADPAVLTRIARLARGGMRDALSLLDQLLSFGQKRIDGQLLEQVLPTAGGRHAAALVKAWADRDPAAALSAVEAADGDGVNLSQLVTDLQEHLRRLLVVAVCGMDSPLCDLAGEQRPEAKAAADAIGVEGLLYAQQVIGEVAWQLKRSSAPRPLVDAAAVRLATAERMTDLAAVVATLTGGQAAAPETGGDDAKKKAPGR
jgi:DNA polymerase-3 subunit gamma/tau